MLVELLALKMIMASLLEATAKETTDPTAFLSRIHATVIEDIQRSRFKQSDSEPEREAALREQMQERVDELLSAMTARVLRSK